MLEGATYGLIFLAVSRLLCMGIAHSLPDLAGVFHQYFPKPYSGTFLGAFIIGPALALTLNLCGQVVFFPSPRPSTRWVIRESTLSAFGFTCSFAKVWLRMLRTCREVLTNHLPGRVILALLSSAMPNRHMANVDAILKFGDQLEKILLKAHLGAHLLMFSLRTGKVYVAWLIESPANLDGRSKYFVVLPYLSGFRDTEKGAVEYTTDYYALLRSGVPWEELSKLLVVDDVAYINRFSEEHRETFDQEQGQIFLPGSA